MAINGNVQAHFQDSETSTLTKLQSKEHEESLNIVDQLRSEGIGRYVDVPQIIVCGDQSSGKSSVLGAISGISFPWRDNICTRFAIELILRRASESSVSISIYPDSEHSSEEKERLRNFTSPAVGLEYFTDIVKSAEDYIGVGKDGLLFSKDVLRVEVSGPTQPHLTLVDLPGLYHAADENQNDEGVQFVESLVLSYMQKSRSVILAVVSAKSDIALQKVTAFTRRVDFKGERTLGVITKPDTLSVGSDMEQSFVKLARNERLRLQLGWHVLKNRGFEDRNSSIAERDASESKFLATGIWSSLPRSQVGVGALRPRLSHVLKDHILSQMPSFVAEIQSSLKETESSLRKLGRPRKTTNEQRRYLLHSSERFTLLIGNAIDGVYFDAFFGNSMDEDGYTKRLRATLQNQLSDFADVMRERGEERKIVDVVDDDSAAEHQGQKYIAQSDYIKEVQQRMRRSRGKELPGTFNPLIIGELFYLQSQPWLGIVLECIETILGSVRKAIMLILQEVLDERSIDGILDHVMNEQLQNLERNLRIKTQELLKPQQMGHPITYNHYFIETIQKSRAHHYRESLIKKIEGIFGQDYTNERSNSRRREFSMVDLISALEGRTEEDMDSFACTEAMDCMQAYYKVARKKFIDDFSNLAVEKCLLEPLLTIFCPRTVEYLAEEIVEDIAYEDESTTRERDRLEEKIAILQGSAKKLHRLDRLTLSAVGRLADTTEQIDFMGSGSSPRRHAADLEDMGVVPVEEKSLEEPTVVEEQVLKEDLNLDDNDPWPEFQCSRPSKKNKKKKHCSDPWECS